MPESRLVGYAPGMKTAISVPDAVYAEAERLARRLGKSRSHLYTEALVSFLRRHDGDSVTQAYDRICASVDTAPDPALNAASRRVLERSEW